jgi:hypothetical protein
MRSRDKQPPPLPEIDVARARTYPLSRRPSLVEIDGLARPYRPGQSLRSFLAGLPAFLAAQDLRVIAGELARRQRAGKRIVLGMGAHPIKVGLGPVIVDLMRRGMIHGLAVNGATMIHDFELAFAGRTSEDVGAHLTDGRFGMARETGEFLNRAAAAAAAEEGLGEAVARAMAEADLPYAHSSIFVAAHRYEVPLTVHVAIGTDIVHMHPSADGAAIGRATLADFRKLVRLAAGLHEGAFVLLGSAVVLPEVFVKAVSLARNLGFPVGGLLTVNLDFLRHYRPQRNVLERPTQPDGRGYHLTGHHEILFPLLCAAWMEALRDSRPHPAARRKRKDGPRRRVTPKLE